MFDMRRREFVIAARRRGGSVAVRGASAAGGMPVIEFLQ